MSYSGEYDRFSVLSCCVRVDAGIGSDWKLVSLRVSFTGMIVLCLASAFAQVNLQPSPYSKSTSGHFPVTAPGIDHQLVTGMFDAPFDLIEFTEGHSACCAQQHDTPFARLKETRIGIAKQRIVGAEIPLAIRDLHALIESRLRASPDHAGITMPVPLSVIQSRRRPS